MDKPNQKPCSGGFIALFNSLSFPGRLQLRAASATSALTRVMREDTKRHPWAFPLYAAYLFVLTAPVPTFGIATATAILGAVCASSLNNDWSRRLRGRLKESFNPETMPCGLRPFIVPDNQKPDGWRVDSWALTKHTSRSGWRDTSDAASYAWGRLTGTVPISAGNETDCPRCD